MKYIPIANIENLIFHCLKLALIPIFCFLSTTTLADINLTGWKALSRSDSRVFDPTWYLNAHGDLKAAFDDDLNAARNHWLNNGIYECRQGSMAFNPLEYLDMYDDLERAFGRAGCADAIDHYIKYGASEGRVGRYILDSRVFNPIWYVNAYPDLKAAFGDDYNAAKNHWLHDGSAECRQANAFFPPLGYLNKYDDLSVAFGAGNCPQSSQHYVQFGFSEGRFINPIKVYAGGVDGILDLQDANNSNQFRRFGGGLYIHSWAWGQISDIDRRAILASFQGSPIAVEFGFGFNSWWGQVFQDQYQIYGINPTYITANAFDSGYIPTVLEWKNYVDMLRQHGVADSAKIYATFEYQNYHFDAKLLANTVSKNSDFQEIITISRGIVIDVPAGVAIYQREEAYRQWIVDAIKWTRNRGYTAIIINSPDSSGGQWEQHTAAFVDFLSKNNAIPNEFVSENYHVQDDDNYINVVGSENNSNNTLGIGLKLLRGLF